MNTKNVNENSCVDRLRQHFKTKQALLATYGITRQAFDAWIHHGICAGYVKRLLEVERKSDGTITAEQIISEARKRK